MKSASTSIPLTQAAPANQVISAVVISEAKPQESGAGQTPNGGREIRLGDSHLESPVRFFLIFGIIAAGGLFCALFYLFFKAHHRKLELGRE